jgi:homoserine kinase
MMSNSHTSFANNLQRATAFAPAGVGNVAVGFDLIGHALDAHNPDGSSLGDSVTVTLTHEPEVQITAITGLDIPLPSAAHENTAGRAVLAFQRALGLAHGFNLRIKKGIPLGSGLGGSAASAVAAVVAANAACGSPLSLEALYPFALEGECAASGAKHGDNVGPQLLGGLCFTNAERCIRLPVPEGLTAVVVHPDTVLETKTARAALNVPFRISEFVAQSDKLAGFLIALYHNDLSLLRASLADVLVEPRRAPLIPGFAEVKQAALDLGAIGASISGAGPSVFAWFSDRISAERASFNMKSAFARAGLPANAYVAPVAGRGARVVIG